MGGLKRVQSSELIQLAARIPISRELQYFPRDGRDFQSPKWYQFKPRSVLGTPWLEGLIDTRVERNSIILADEGGVGKTKAAVLAVNNILNEHPNQPILIVCQRRMIRDWRNELENILPHRKDSIHGGEQSGAISVLSDIRPGNIYIVSKHSLSINLGYLEEHWGKAPSFSLIVIDEAHQGKSIVELNELAGKVENENELKEGSKLYKALKKICTKYCDRKLAVTASPLSLDTDELLLLGQQIGVKPEYLEVFGNADKDDKFLDNWAKALEPCRELFDKVDDDVVEEDIIRFKDKMKDSIFFLPHREEIQQILDDKDNSKWLICPNQRKIWLNEMNPLSPFVTATLRHDLGSEAEELFRIRNTWTQSVPLHKDHLQALTELGEDVENLDFGNRYNQSWPTNHMKGTPIRCSDSQFDYSDADSRLTSEEPRINVILKEILPKDPVLRAGTLESRKGAVIFSNVLRTVEQISLWLDGKSISSGKTNITIRTHELTGGVLDAVAILNEIDKELSEKPNEYHIVIGTSAIQEGLSMNWATTIIHWDLVSNPQILEQRTWRLDRHRTEVHADSFNVVYLITDTKSDEKMVSTIRDRSKLASKILGQPYCEDAWPKSFDGNNASSPSFQRKYPSTAQQFFHPKARELASIFHNIGAGNNHPTEIIRNRQQEAILIGLSEANDWDLDIKKLLKTGTIEAANLQDPKSKQCKGLRAMIALAKHHDRFVLQSLHPQDIWNINLRLDKMLNKSKTLPQGRNYSVTLDPKGALLSRLMRRLEGDYLVIKGPKNLAKTVVFSIDCTTPLADYEWELGNLMTLLKEDSNTLFKYNVSKSESGIISLTEDSEIIIRMLENIVKSKTHTQSPVPNLQKQCRIIINTYVTSINTRCAEITKRIDEISDEIADLEEELEFNDDEVIRNTKRKKERQLKMLEDEDEQLEYWQNHLKDALENDLYVAKTRYAEGYN